MGQLELRQLDSIGQLRDAAPAWDRLWQRSEVSLPTARAELVAEWLEHFAPKAAFRALVVWQDGRLVAALPLVARRVRGVVPVGDLTGNYWSPNGELLLDPGVDTAEVMDLFAGGVEKLPWPLVWLETVPLESSRWQGMIHALIRHGLATDVHPRYRIGQVEIDGDFQRYEAERSKNLRRQLRKDLRRLERDAPVELKVYGKLTPEEVEEPLRRAFEIEKRSWKDRAGGSVLGTPGMFDFYHRQGRRLATWGCLRLAFLEHRGKPIAFELGWTAKGVYHSFKVGYDRSYRQSSPGHLLRKCLIETLFHEPGHVLVDFQGPMSEALRPWSTRSYQIARVVVAPRRLGSRALFAGYRTLAPVVRQLRAVAGTRD